MKDTPLVAMWGLLLVDEMDVHMAKQLVSALELTLGQLLAVLMEAETVVDLDYQMELVMDIELVA